MIFLIFLLDSIVLTSLLFAKKYDRAIVYFCLSRMLIAVYAVFYYFDYFSNYTSKSISPLNTGITATYLLIGIITFFFMYFARTHRILSVVSALVLLLGIILIFFLNSSIGPNARSSSSTFAKNIIEKRTDRQTSVNLQKIANCISIESAGIGRTGTTLPRTLQNVVSKCGNAQSVNSITNQLSNYKYTVDIPSGTNASYHLCAYFNNSTKASIDRNTDNANSHGKGYQCISYSPAQYK
jgi:hypothetical protein